MKYTNNTLYFLVGMFLLVGCSKPAPPTEPTNHLEVSDGFSSDQVKLIFENAKKFPNGIQLAISILDSNRVMHYGIERRNDSIIMIQNHSDAFEIGSISKVFTATLLAQEVSNGNLNLEDPINDVYPFQFKDSIEFTYLRLSNHTSNLPRVPPGMIWNSLTSRDNPYKKFTAEKLETYLKEKVSIRNDTPKYKYSNLAVGILGYTLSKKTGMSYAQLLDERIFEPLEMQNSTVVRDDVSDILVKGRDEYGGIVPNWDLGPLAPAGAILSTSEDLIKFARAQLDTTNLAMALTRKETFIISENTSIGLGWHILKRENRTLYSHNGGTGGYKSCMAVDVENQQSVVVLSNLSAGSPEAQKIDKTCFALTKTL